MGVVLVAHPSPDVYGSDRQLLEAVIALEAASERVVVVLPTAGPLRALLERTGAEVRTVPFAVLRRALLTPLGIVSAGFGVLFSIRRLVRLIRAVAPDVVYVNTVTIPWWVVAARIAGVPVVVHVHEAEEEWPRPVRWLLTSPLLFASCVITNSRASRRTLVESVARLAGRSSVVYNGIVGPDAVTPRPEVPEGVPVRLALVARLSPRKGIDVALEAIALLRAEGRAVELDVCGSVFVGYEWFERQLRERVAASDLAGAVHFRGYVNPTWPVLATASVVLVPSRMEPFGNTAVEGLLAARPVVASAVQGLPEIVTHERTGLLVPPGDAVALAAAVARLLDDPELAAALGDAGRDEALERFSIVRYHHDVVDTLNDVVTRSRA